MLPCCARWSLSTPLVSPFDPLSVPVLQALCAPGARVHMLVGFDTWVRITDPKYYAEGQVGPRS